MSKWWRWREAKIHSPPDSIEMGYNTNGRKRILEASDCLLWFDQKDMAEFFTGKRVRMKFIEYQLPRLVKEGKLFAVRKGRRLCYTRTGKAHKNRKSTINMEHGLICTKALLRFFLASRDVEIISEKFFLQAKFGSVPEWAISYPSGVMLLFEYSTADNFNRPKTMRNKLNQYRESLGKIEDFFDKKAIVLFVFEAANCEVKSFVQKNNRESDTFFYFTDLTSFLEVKKGEQLAAPIYIWGGDGKSYPLGKND